MEAQAQREKPQAQREKSGGAISDRIIDFIFKSNTKQQIT